MGNDIPAHPAGKPYGIRVKLPDEDPMSAPHLLGDAWAGMRWYETAESRDAALAQMRNQPKYYRRGDIPSMELLVVDPASQ